MTALWRRMSNVAAQGIDEMYKKGWRLSTFILSLTLYHTTVYVRVGFPHHTHSSYHPYSQIVDTTSALLQHNIVFVYCCYLVTFHSRADIPNESDLYGNGIESGAYPQELRSICSSCAPIYMHKGLIHWSQRLRWLYFNRDDSQFSKRRSTVVLDLDALDWQVYWRRT